MFIYLICYFRIVNNIAKGCNVGINFSLIPQDARVYRQSSVMPKVRVNGRQGCPKRKDKPKRIELNVKIIKEIRQNLSVTSVFRLKEIQLKT